MGRRELSALVAEVWDPYGDYYPVEKFPDRARPLHGVTKMALSGGVEQAWEHFEFKVKAINPVRDDRVLVRASLVAEGRGSGLNLQGELFHCSGSGTGGSFVRRITRLTLLAALLALGLSGETLEAAGLRE